MNLFDELDKFFLSFGDYFTFNHILWLFAALFLATMIIVIIVCSRTYESKLIKSIDKFNNYFASNPQITEDNLFQFNNMMKSNGVPKQLRKQWQQFVLYREDKASAYMSFDICVSSPLKNSGYKRAVKVMNILSYIYVLLSVLFNAYCMYENLTDVGWFFQHMLITPVLILLLNYVVTIFMDARYNAIVADIYANYQYFTINMDKATSTIPEYVDYEVLFDKNEIKRGIPILYAYLQRRAEEEKRELDRARLKNIEHEKFNFDEAGIESSLVLERAMQEAENYIAERKKYLQDVEQINSEITQEELNFREATKEYQRQMQVSKESFANFKEQLEQVSSSIEANYLKKQQQQELDRQRNLERDYDSANENHKRVMENFQAELTNLENEIKQSRVTLEKGMMSEFSTYSNKVYDAAKKLVDEREQQQKLKLKAEIKTLEEKLAAKDQELNNIYAQNQQLNSKIINSGENTNLAELAKVANSMGKAKKDEDDDGESGKVVDDLLKDSTPVSEKKENEDFSFNYAEETEENNQVTDASGFTFNYLDEEPTTNTQVPQKIEEPLSFNYLDEEPVQEEKPTTATEQDIQDINDFSFDYLDEEDEEEESEPEVESKPAPKIVKSPGRPRKVVTEPAEKRGRGRPKKTEEQKAKSLAVSTRRPGRPKKAETAVASTTTKKVGRPKKATTTTTSTAQQKKVGRPKKATTTVQPKRSAGRPKKEVASVDQLDELEAYLKEIDAQIAEENKKIAQTRKELEKDSSIKRRRN